MRLPFRGRATALVAMGLLLSALALPSWAQQFPDTSATRAQTNLDDEAEVAEPTASAKALFERAKSAIVQVRLLLQSASEQSTIGSGFVVKSDPSQGTWVVTNYHVVSSLALHPDRYRIELRGTDQRIANARLVAIDVRHDLAVLHIEPEPNPWPTLELRSAPLSQGSHIYSLGNPLELGFLISEGLYNGLVENRLYDQILFSGALNPGMSGGPAIDSAAHVIGVNVATRRDGELLSFLVPLTYLRPLLDAAYQSQPQDKWLPEIGRQLSEHQAFITARLLGKPDGESDARTASGNGLSSQTLVNRAVVTLDSRITRCWAAGSTSDKAKIHSDSLNCRMNDSLYVSEGGYTGYLDIRHTLMRNKSLATAQFLGLRSDPGYYGLGGGSRTAPRCKQTYVQAKAHAYRTTVCMKAYQKFDKLYDVTVEAEQIDDTQERLTSVLSLSGFSFENAQRLGKVFMERLQ